MTPKPLGYYGLNLDISTELAIDGLPMHEHMDLLDDMINDLLDTHYLCNDEAPEIIDEHKVIFPSQLSDLDKIALIRGLCDRIEVKLMEAAQ